MPLLFTAKADGKNEYPWSTCRSRNLSTCFSGYQCKTTREIRFGYNLKYSFAYPASFSTLYSRLNDLTSAPESTPNQLQLVQRLFSKSRVNLAVELWQVQHTVSPVIIFHSLKVFKRPETLSNWIKHVECHFGFRNVCHLTLILAMPDMRLCLDKQNWCRFDGNPLYPDAEQGRNFDCVKRCGVLMALRQDP